MANSWNGPQLGSPIRTDVPELQKKLIALLKGDPTSVADIPSGAKRLVNTSDVQWQVQQYNGSSWAAIGKLMHDVDKLDGYHAAITPNANTVAVRNANKQLEGDITGNAATASTATTLSETLPVNKGGTGATTSAQARTNLGVPPTSHASSGATYGLATDTLYGHIRSDGKTTKIMSGQVIATDIAAGGDSSDPASGRGQIGDTPWIRQAVIDFNTYTRSGAWWVTWDDKALNAPETDAGSNGLLVVYAAKGLEGTVVRQFFYRWGTAGTTDKNMWTRSISSNVTEWGPWYRINSSSRTIINVDSQSDNTSVVGMPFGIYGKGVDGVKRTLFPFRFVPGNNYGNGLVIDTGGLVVVGGGESGRTVSAGLVNEGSGGELEKLYLTSDNSIDILYNQNSGYDKSKRLSVYSTGVVNLSAEIPTFGCTELSYDRLETLTENKTLFSHIVYDKHGVRVAGLYNVKYTNGVTKYGILTYAHGVSKNVYSEVYSCIDKDGNRWGEAPTPSSDSNRNEIATTEWVRNYTLPTGALIPSLATRMTGYLLCNGAAVSRTTYANLFSIIGTKFGAGDGSKTFNLPDFRNRVFWGASGNLMRVIEAGLPDHSHPITLSWDSRDCGYASGSPRFWQGFQSGSTGAASASNAIYGKSTTVQPPAIAVNIFIKY